MAYTLEDIARLAGVSRSTVSRVVNNHPSVRPEVRQRVWQVIREVGYQPHAAARNLATRRSDIIGLVIPEAVSTLFTDPFFSLLIRGITDACYEQGYHLMLALFSTPAQEEDLYNRLLRSHYLDGVILASTRLDDPLIERLVGDRVPFVSVGRHPHPQVSYVDVDNVAGARMAVDHLIRQGHTRVGTITGPLNMAAGQDRLEGYKQSLAAHHIPLDDRLIVEGDFTENGGLAGMNRLLALEPPPTAVFVASDTMAMGALRAVRQAGLRVPEDVAIIGFDDVPQATYLDPPLTTVRQPIQRLGEIAVRVLVDVIAQGPEIPQRVVLMPELVVRSTG